jgi:dolichol-phosphate mannosyltransferase
MRASKSVSGKGLQLLAACGVNKKRTVGMTSGEVSSSTVAVSVVVPCYNEAGSVSRLAALLRPAMDILSEGSTTELVLVDDGSTDGTHAALRETFQGSERWEVKLVCHERNQGLGAALGTGFRAARGEIICCMDSDCTYHPSVLAQLVDQMAESGADIVSASPYHPDGHVEGVPR